jgi:Fe-S-cluster containining protein
MKSPIERARFVHNLVDEYNKDTLDHPLIEKLSPCKRGCSACCNTEVSATPDEAELLAERVMNGLQIDLSRLHIQKSAKENNKSYYSVPYEMRACVFLGDDNQCRAYEDRPSVCRTNVVLGDADQCSTKDGQMKNMRLLKTENADMVIIGHFMINPSENDSLANLLWKKLAEKKVLDQNIVQTIAKNISKDREL